MVLAVVVIKICMTQVKTRNVQRHIMPPWLLLLKRGFDRRVINKYREPVIKRFIL